MKKFKEILNEYAKEKSEKKIVLPKMSQIKVGTKFVNKNNYTLTIKKITNDSITYDWFDNVSKDKGEETISKEKFEVFYCKTDKKYNTNMK